MGYQLDNRHWGKGYAREALKVLIPAVFRDLKFHRLEAIVNLDNPRSIRLCEALGLQDEGVKRKYLFENGKWTDHRCFSAIPDDFGIRASKPYRFRT